MQGAGLKVSAPGLCWQKSHESWDDLFHSTCLKSMLTPVSSKNLPDTPCPAAKHQDNTVAGVNTVTRKEHCDDKSQVWGLKYHVSKKS
jgi:hypothetical protein